MPRFLWFPLSLALGCQHAVEPVAPDSNEKSVVATAPPPFEPVAGIDLPTLGNSNPDADFLRAPFRVGLNMVRTRGASDEVNSITAVNTDIAALGAGGVRQLRDWDVGWIANGFWDGSGFDADDFDFTDPDRALTNNAGVYAIPTFFQVGPESVVDRLVAAGVSENDVDEQLYTPDGVELDMDDSYAKQAVESYVTAIVERYQGTLYHYEVANEVEHYYDTNCFLDGKCINDKRYVDLLEEVAESAHAVDPDIQIVMAGLAWHETNDGGVDNDQKSWLKGVINEGGDEYIDVYNFHYYGKWTDLPSYIGELQAILDDKGEGDKPLWMTEVGSTYLAGDGGSESGQAADVARMLAIAHCHGVELSMWHTHISSTDDTGEAFAGYGLRKSDGDTKAKSYYAFQAITEVLNASVQCTRRAENSNGRYVYEFQDESGDKTWVMFTTGASTTYNLDPYTSASSVSVTSVIANGNGNRTTTTASATAVPLGSSPTIVSF